MHICYTCALQVSTKRSLIAPNPQLTLTDWQMACAASPSEPDRPADDTPAPPVEQARTVPSLDVVTTLAEALAPRLAEQLATRIMSVATYEPATRPLLTLDELVAELPTAKPAKTWKRWLYERTRRGEVPGCVKLGGMLFFEKEPVRAWIRAGAGTIQPTRR